VSHTWDYKSKRAIAADVPSPAANAGPNAPSLEHYSPHSHHGAYAAASATQAQRSATHLQQALEARHKTFLGRGTVRSFTAGTHFVLTDSDMALLDELDDDRQQSTPDRHRYLITRVSHLGINNLPKALPEHIAKTLGATTAFLVPRTG
jgi:type VI secretion system secreted protein VgrG